MAKSIDEPNCVNEIEIFQSENAAHGTANVRCRPSQTVI